MSADRRRRNTVGDDEHDEGRERWMVSYADMVTVLMALFIVLFAISQVDRDKYVELRNGLAEGFGTSSRIPVDGGSGLLQDDGHTPNPTRRDLHAAPAPIDLTGNDTPSEAEALTPEQVRRLAEAEVADLEGLKEQMSSALDAQGLGERVRFRVTERGLVAAVVADDVFFDSASAAIRPAGLLVLDTLAPTLRERPEEIAVEGHANHLPIVSSSLYPTNWELSAARAASVVRHLASAGGVDPVRLIATGFSDTRPLYPPDTAEALAGNRRVDLVVLSRQPAAVRAMLPEVAIEYETGQTGSAAPAAPAGQGGG